MTVLPLANLFASETIRDVRGRSRPRQVDKLFSQHTQARACGIRYERELKRKSPASVQSERALKSRSEIITARHRLRSSAPKAIARRSKSGSNLTRKLPPR